VKLIGHKSKKYKRSRLVALDQDLRRRVYLLFLILLLLVPIAVYSSNEDEAEEEVEGQVGQPMMFWTELTLPEGGVIEFRLYVNGKLVGKKVVRVEPGVPTRIELEWTPDMPGTYHVKAEAVVGLQSFIKKWKVIVKPKETPPPTEPTPTPVPTEVPVPINLSKPDLTIEKLELLQKQDNEFARVLTVTYNEKEGKYEVKWDKAKLARGKLHKIIITVKNIGDGTDKKFCTALHFSDKNYEFYLKGLGTGSSHTHEWYYVPIEKSLRLVAKVDFVNMIEEVNEDNNVLTVQDLRFSEEVGEEEEPIPKLPDLVPYRVSIFDPTGKLVYEAEYDPRTHKLKEKIHGRIYTDTTLKFLGKDSKYKMEIYIQNRGDTEVNNQFLVRVWGYDPENKEMKIESKERSVDFIGKREIRKVIETKVEFSKIGKHEIFVHSDYFDEIYQYDHSNDLQGIDITVGSPDLYLYKVEIRDEKGNLMIDAYPELQLQLFAEKLIKWDFKTNKPLEEGKDYTMKVIIENIGNLEAGESKVGVRLVGKTYELSIPAVKPDEKKEKDTKISLKDLKPGNYKLTIEVDSTNSVEEGLGELINSFELPITIKKGGTFKTIIKFGVVVGAAAAAAGAAKKFKGKKK